MRLPDFVCRAVASARHGVGVSLMHIVGVQDQLDPSRGAIALTFDDGPDPVSTPGILDELRRLDVVATFFLVGRQALACPELVRRMVAEGHQIGSHSHSHPADYPTSLTTIAREYRQGRSEVEQVAQQRVRLFRPPYGRLDGTGALAIAVARLRPWLWTIDPGDWRPGAAPADILAGLDGLSGGDVILLHDAIDGAGAAEAGDRQATTAVLADIVSLASQRKLHFTTLS